MKKIYTLVIAAIILSISSFGWSAEAKRKIAESSEGPRGENIQKEGLIGKVVEFVPTEKTVAIYVKTKSGHVHSANICADTDKDARAQFLDALKTSLIHKTGVRLNADENNCVRTIGYNIGYGYEDAGN